jgi:MFS family permease
MTIAAGLLTTIHWRLVFGVYLIMLPVLLMSIFWLEAPEKNQEKLRLPRHRVVFVISFYMFALNVLLFSMPLYLALHLADLGLGGSLATAMVLVTFNLGGVIMGSIFLPVHKLFGKQTGPAALLMMAIGFFMISTGLHLYLMLGGALLFGLGVGVMNSINYLHLINTVPKEDAPMSVAMLNSIMSLGKFVAPLCYGGLGAVGIVSGAPSIYAFNGLFVLALAVIFGVKRHFFVGSVDVRKEEPSGHQ